jgi:predicted amidohydrolase
MSARDSEQMVAKILSVMNSIVPSQPDCICLPETFNRMNVSSSIPIEDEAAERLGGVATRFAEFAAKHKCYVICPIHTRDGDRLYNSAIVIDRQGEYVGEYRKSHTTVDEMAAHVCPGPLEVPVFETDFGKVGAQICFDVQWDAGWRQLQQQGAEIVFWPSAFAGGKMLAARAWQNQYCIVTSTAKDASRVYDFDGSVLAATNRWQPWTIASVNLERAFLHTWPYVQRFPEILAKYGDRIHIQSHGEEEWSIIESRDPELTVAEIMREFELKTIREHLALATSEQVQQRRPH